MGNELNNSQAAFGSDATAAIEPVAAADAMSGFMMNAALPILASIVVFGFLAFQFGRWFLANYDFDRAADAMGLTDRRPEGVPAAQLPAEGPARPWKSARARKAK